MSEDTLLKREVTAIQIPSGDEITLPVGLRVMITQALGGTYTVATEQGLARIREKDADALGIEKESDAKGEGMPVADGDLEAAGLEPAENCFRSRNSGRYRQPRARLRLLAARRRRENFCERQNDAYRTRLRHGSNHRR